MKTIYKSTVTEMGAEAAMFLEENMLIIFNESAPKDLRDIAVVHKAVQLEGVIEAGDELSFDGQTYEITFVGDKVNETVNELGHCTIAFNGADQADLPGTLCVENKEMPKIDVSTTIMFKKAREA